MFSGAYAARSSASSSAISAALTASSAAARRIVTCAVTRGSVLPRYGIANGDAAVVESLGEHTAAPVGAHGGAKTGHHLVHSFARRRLTGDSEANVANAQRAAARVGQRHATEHEIRPPSRRIGGCAEPAHQRF